MVYYAVMDNQVRKIQVILIFLVVSKERIVQSIHHDERGVVVTINVVQLLDKDVTKIVVINMAHVIFIHVIVARNKIVISKRIIEATN